MIVYQLEKIKHKQIFEDTFPTEFNVSLFKNKAVAIQNAHDYYNRVIERFDSMKNHASLTNEGSYSIFSKKPRSLEDDTLEWIIKAYIQDVTHEIKISVKQNTII